MLGLIGGTTVTQPAKPTTINPTAPTGNGIVIDDEDIREIIGGGSSSGGGSTSTGTWSRFTGPNGNIWTFNSKTRAMEDTGVSAGGASSGSTNYQSKVGANGNWWNFNPSTGEYTDTGIPSQGSSSSAGGPPETRTIGGKLYQWDDASGKWILAPGVGLPSAASAVGGGGGTSGLGSLFNDLVKSASKSSGGTSFDEQLALINARADAAIRQAQGSDASDMEKFLFEQQIIAQRDEANRQLELAKFKANYGLDIANFQRLDRADRAQMAKDLASVISSTDPAALPAFLAGGGGLIENSLAHGNTALTDNAMLPAAQLLYGLDQPGQAFPTIEELLAQFGLGGTGTGGGIGSGTGLGGTGTGTGGTSGGLPNPAGGTTTAPASNFNIPNTPFGAPSNFGLQGMPGGTAAQVGLSGTGAVAFLPGGGTTDAGMLQSALAEDAIAGGNLDLVKDKFGRDIYHPEFGKGDPDVLNRLARGDFLGGGVIGSGPLAGYSTKDIASMPEVIDQVVRMNANTPQLLQAAGLPLPDQFTAPVQGGQTAPNVTQGAPRVASEDTFPIPEGTGTFNDVRTPLPAPVAPTPLPSAADIAAAGGQTAYAASSPNWTFIPGQGLTYVEKKATGGKVQGDQAIVGDPRVPGLPNPELVDFKKKTVTPLDMPEMHQMMMDGTEAYADGTKTWVPGIGWTDNPNATFSVPSTSTAPVYEPPTNYYSAPTQVAPAPAPEPVYTPPPPPPPPAPVPAPAPAPTTTSTGGQQTVTGGNLSGGGQIVQTPPPAASTPAPAPAPAPTPSPNPSPAPPLSSPALQDNPLGGIYSNPNIPIPDYLQSYIQQVGDIRRNVTYPQLNPYDVSYFDQLPTIQELFLQGRQAQFGIPVQDQLAELQKQRLPGASRSALALGL